MSDASKVTTNTTPVKLQGPQDATTTIPTPSPDIFDPVKLRLSQDFEAEGGVKMLTTVPVRKPDRQSFFRVHPEESWRLPTAVLEFKEERETYLVAPELRADLAGEVVSKVLFTALNRQGVVFLWPVKLPSSDGRHDDWNRSALVAAEMGMKRWVRVAANMHLGAYETFAAPAHLPEPIWPDLSFSKILEIAFRDRFIQTLDHPVIRRLRGEL